MAMRCDCSCVGIESIRIPAFFHVTLFVNHAATSKHVTTDVQHVATRRRVERVLVPAFFRDPTLISAAGGLMAEREWLFDNKNVLDFIVVREATSQMRTT
jgi:hypothetical protein